MTREDLTFAFLAVIATIVFIVVILPIAIDREIDRQETVAAYNWQHYGQYMEGR